MTRPAKPIAAVRVPSPLPSRSTSDLASDARFAVARLFGAVSARAPSKGIHDHRFAALRLAMFAIKIVESAEYASHMMEVLERLDAVIHGPPLVRAVHLVEGFSVDIRHGDEERSKQAALVCLAHLRALNLDAAGEWLRGMTPARLRAAVLEKRPGRPAVSRGLLARILEPDDPAARAYIDGAIKKALERIAQD